MVYSCEMCSGYRVPFVALDIATIFNHYGRYHRHDPNFFLRCKVDGCGASYRKLEGYRSHLRRHHKDIALQNERLEDRVNHDDNTSGEDEVEPQCENQNDDIDIQNDMPEAQAADVDFKKQNALFLLKTKEMHKLTQTATDSVVSDTTQIVKNTVEQLKAQINDCLDNAGIQMDDVPGLKNIFKPENPLSNPFEGLERKTEQRCYFRNNFGLVEPEKHILGHHHIQMRSGTMLKTIAKPDEMVVVPLVRSLEAMLNNPSVLYEIEHPHLNQVPNGRIYDFCDSDGYKAHPLFSKDPSALQIILYFDEVECVNAIGSKTKTHKLGVFYYTLGNIRPKYRSQLKSIQLLAVVKRSLINKYGINAVLKPLMAEVIELERDCGCEFMVNGEKRNFCGTIAFVSGDNLGQQELGGFKVGPGAHLKCRECMGLADDIKRMFHESHFTLRTCEEHDDQCDEIEEDPTLSSSYGVNFMSALCQSRYYHVIRGLPGDAMHDVLESCLQYECKELLKYLIHEQKYFNLNHLNSSMKKFDFGYQNDKNKPSPISDATLHSNSNTLHQNASQMWCLARFLPLIVGAKVPETDDKWQLYLKMLYITDMILSPVASANQAANLALVIEEHHTEFKLLYPNCSIIPKMHYLIHYPRIMTSLGPMMTNWCMRFEAKHSYLKKLASGIGNFINLAWTLAERHQFRQCYMLCDIEKPIECGSGKHCKAGTTTYYELLKEKDPQTNEDSDITESSWVSVLGTLYKVGAVVQTGFNHFLPQFSIVKKIAAVDADLNRLFFVVESLDTIEYNEHYHSCRVEKPIEKSIGIYKQDDFPTFLPLHYTSPLGDVGLYVNMKYDVDLFNVL